MIFAEAKVPDLLTAVTAESNCPGYCPAPGVNDLEE